MAAGAHKGRSWGQLRISLFSELMAHPTFLRLLSPLNVPRLYGRPQTRPPPATPDARRSPYLSLGFLLMVPCPGQDLDGHRDKLWVILENTKQGWRSSLDCPKVVWFCANSRKKLVFGNGDCMPGAGRRVHSKPGTPAGQSEGGNHWGMCHTLLWLLHLRVHKPVLHVFLFALRVP